MPCASATKELLPCRYQFDRQWMDGATAAVVFSPNYNWRQTELTNLSVFTNSIIIGYFAEKTIIHIVNKIILVIFRNHF